MIAVVCMLVMCQDSTSSRASFSFRGKRSNHKQTSTRGCCCSFFLPSNSFCCCKTRREPALNSVKVNPCTLDLSGMKISDVPREAVLFVLTSLVFFHLTRAGALFASFCYFSKKLVSSRNTFDIKTKDIRPLSRI
jgi:hypothetical protein